MPSSENSKRNLIADMIRCWLENKYNQVRYGFSGAFGHLNLYCGV